MRLITFCGEFCGKTDDSSLKYIKRYIGEYFPSQILDIISSSPGCVSSFMECFGSAFKHGDIYAASERLKMSAVAISRLIPLISDHLRWLYDEDYSREDIRQIRYVVEVFHNIEPIFAEIAAYFELWCSSRSFGKGSKLSTTSQQRVKYLGGIEFPSEIECQSQAISSIDLRGLPLHPFYRALSLWPRYLDKVVGDIVNIDILSEARKQIADTARHLAKTVNIDDECCDFGDKYRYLEIPVASALEVSCEVIIISTIIRRGFISA